MFRAVTNGHGEARLPWLPSDEYHLQVVDPCWMRHAKDPRELARKPAMPGEPIVLSVLQPHVAVIRFEGAAVVDAAAARCMSPVQSPVTPLIAAAGALEQRLRRQFPDHGVYVGFQKTGAAEPMALQGEVMLQKGGLAPFAAQAIRMADFREVQVVRLDESAVAGGGSLLIELDPSLQPLEAKLGLRTLWQMDNGRMRSLQLRNGRNPVPSGRHQVGCTKVSFGYMVPDQVCEVAVGSEVTLRVAPRSPLREVHLKAVVPSGSRLPGAQVVVVPSPRQVKETSADYAGPWYEPFDVYLPVGSYDVRTWTADYEEIWTPFTVDAATGPPLEVRIELTPKAKKP